MLISLILQDKLIVQFVNMQINKLIFSLEWRAIKQLKLGVSTPNENFYFGVVLLTSLFSTYLSVGQIIDLSGLSLPFCTMSQ